MSNFHTSRRKVISGIGAGALATTAGFGPSSSAATSRPNILFIMSDQEQYTNHLPSLHRPNHERLAKNGLTFQHQYVSNPVCSPSRATIFTGLYPWQSGVIENVDIYQNGPQLDPKFPTIGSVFAAAGYQTGYFGKWHLNWLVEDPIMVDEDYNGGRRDQLAQYGFGTSFIPNDSDDRPLGKRWDGEISRKASAWIKATQTSGKPWLAVVSLVNPHDIPFTSLYDDIKIPDYPIVLPKSWNEDTSKADIPPELRRPRPNSAALQQLPGAFGVQPHDEASWHDYIRRYCYLLEDCDQHVGTVMDSLESSGAQDNTMVFYTSDHGEMAGAHGRVAKSVMYEEAVTVPLIISNPVRFPRGRVVDALSSHLDLAPTVAGCAGIKWPTPLRGINLLNDKRDAVFSVSGHKPWVQMVRTRDWKLVTYPSGAMQLFDLNNDLDELNNRANDLALTSVKAELLARIKKEFS
jgi:choline-sulfatase